MALGGAETGSRDELVQLLQAAADDECENLAAAFAALPKQTLSELNDAWSELSPGDAARLALVNAQLGDTQVLDGVLQFRADPKFRVAFIHGFDRWGSEHYALLSVARESQRPATLSGVCKAIGRLSTDRVRPDIRADMIIQLQRMYIESPSGCVHSAAEWALHRWSADIPSLDNGTNQDEWFVNRSGVTMVRIPAGDGANGPAQSFFISAKEIDNQLFMRFVDELSAESPHYKALSTWSSRRRDVGGTAGFMSYCEAARFCNWLSYREGRSKFYVDFEQAEYQGTFDRTPVLERFKTVESADGYRLANSRQFLWVCQSYVSTYEPLGDGAERLLPEYIEPLTLPDGGTNELGSGHSRLPNDFGVFDTLGNAMDWVTPAMTEQADDGEVFLWGAAPGENLVDIKCDTTTSLRPIGAYFAAGFHVVCPD